MRTQEEIIAQVRAITAANTDFFGVIRSGLLVYLSRDQVAEFVEAEALCQYAGNRMRIAQAIYHQLDAMYNIAIEMRGVDWVWGKPGVVPRVRLTQFQDKKKTKRLRYYLNGGVKGAKAHAVAWRFKDI